MQKAGDPAIKEFSQRLATEHEKLRATLRQLAETNGITVDPQTSRPAWQGEPKDEGLSGLDFDREYMRWQLRTHLATVGLYQVQASNTPQMEPDSRSRGWPRSSASSIRRSSLEPSGGSRSIP